MKARVLSSHRIAGAALNDMLEANPGLAAIDGAVLLARALILATAARPGDRKARKAVASLVAEFAPQEHA